MVDNLKRLIQERDYSILSLSKASGVPYATVHDIISGKTEIASARYDTLRRLAKTLEISTEYLVEAGEKGEEKDK